MTETEKDQSIASSKTGEHHSSKKKSSSKTAAHEGEVNGEKKRKAPKIIAGDGEHVYESNLSKPVEKEASNGDQEVPAKPKKKRAPKAETETNENNGTDEPIKKKKSKAPKVAPIDDEFHMIEATAVDEIEPYVETKPKVKKSKKSKTPSKPRSDSFEDVQVTNLDDVIPEMGEMIPDPDPDMYPNDIPIAGNDIGEYQQSIIDIYSNLASKMKFSDYVGDDNWCVVHLPKGARNEHKSRIRKMIPGASKDDNKPGAKSNGPKPKLFTRFRTSVSTLVRDPNNLLFGEQATHELNEEYDDPNDVDTDDLHRYAQKLRELEDQDREVNPEFLVLHDGKTVYGVHESDADGKVTLSKRKPIYDRAADQKPDDQVEKKKLLSRLKVPFTRNKDGKDSKSAASTPDSRFHRKSSRKSLNNEMTVASNDDPILI
ncbi:hypothetical protein I4U23_013724 [Adineta vaga]|nr:hypothetical protein I4U23_013724 [Adineta vaga]